MVSISSTYDAARFHRFGPERTPIFLAGQVIGRTVTLFLDGLGELALVRSDLVVALNTHVPYGRKE